MDLFEGRPRPLALALALEDHGAVALAQGDAQDAAGSFSRALEIYAHAGAAWDAGRVAAG